MLCHLCHALSLLSRCSLRYMICILRLFMCAGIPFFLFSFLSPCGLIIYSSSLILLCVLPSCYSGVALFTSQQWPESLHFGKAFEVFCYLYIITVLLLLLVLVHYYKIVATLSFHVSPVPFKLKGLLSLDRWTVSNNNVLEDKGLLFNHLVRFGLFLQSAVSQVSH